MNLEDVIKIIGEEYDFGKVKQIASKELRKKIEGKGITCDDMIDALNEAQRRKIIKLDSGFYKWIDPSLREAEKARTERYFKILAEIFKEGKIKFIPEEDVKNALRERGFGDEEIDEILIEAERDFVLDFDARSLGPEGKLVRVCSWVPREERSREAEAEKDRRAFFEKWLEKKILQDDY